MTQTKMKFCLDDILREQFKRSYYQFVLYFWDTIISEPLIDNWHIKYLCDELQYVSELAMNKKEREYDLIIKSGG